jgi:hypothetical protein
VLLFAKGVAANGEVARILHHCDYHPVLQMFSEIAGRQSNC